jgi:2-dehydro-3-deoxygluconokinase
MTRVACIGEAMIELSMQGTTAAVGVAGDTLNTAIYLKRAAPDVQVDYITRLGDDPFSGQIIDAIKAEDIRTENIDIATGETPGLYAITTDEAGERSFTYWRSNAAARALFSDGDFGRLAGYDLIYLSGISLAILPDAVRHNLRTWLATNKTLLAYDSNYRPRLWEDADTARKTNASFWSITDIALPSIDDEMELFEETEEQVASRWKAATCSGALKQGPGGPMSIGAPVDQTYPPAPNVVDTTAAGDSFNGGYLAARLSGANQPEALRAGHDLAANVVQHRGAIIPRQTQ